MDASSAGAQHTQQPIVTVTSVLAIPYKDGGWNICFSSLNYIPASYGSLARFKDIQRLYPLEPTLLLHIQALFDESMIGEFTEQDDHFLGPRWKEIRGTTLYGDWLIIWPGSLLYVDLLGTTYSASTLATGYGSYIAQPLLCVTVIKLQFFKLKAHPNAELAIQRNLSYHSAHNAEGVVASPALQALLQSFGPDAAQNVSPEALQRLSDKLSELMGADVVRDAFAYNDQPAQTNNNEMPPNAGTSGMIVTEEPPLIPLSSLSPSEQDLRRRERERLLDLLEAEEALEQHREREREARQRKEALDKRREDGKTERERLLALKETHKKMGKALLRSEIATKEGDEKTSSSSSTPNPAQSRLPRLLTKRRVSASKPTAETVDWGDLSRGRLRPIPKRAAPDFSRDSERLMKLQVVERTGGSINPEPSRAPERVQMAAATGIDSDDESDVGSLSAEDGINAGEVPDSDTEHSDEVEEEDTDWDFAQHQREIALEYHRKREKLGKETVSAFTSHTHGSDEDGSPVPNKPHISSESGSLSLGESSILPEDSVQALQKSIRLGKLDEQKRLVGGEDSDSDAETAREILELLQKGDVYNIGPNGEYIPSNAAGNAAGSTKGPPAQIPPFTPPTEPLPQKTKASRFKLSKTQVEASRADTPVSTVSRSSPKLPQETMKSSVAERQPVGSKSSSSRLSQDTIKSSIIERQLASSKLPHQSSQPSAVPHASPPPPPNPSTSMIVESPSFPHSSQRRPDRPPSIMSSTVVESSRKDESRFGPSSQEEEGPVKRVSRFRAERM
ncbi:hypothetical protein BDP27DRAFT_1357282 [Rhodocollybia butyracea]|uniref:DUF3835 domain-containing protein n=1 Tax=Rhodocollybia butyracea TaxID=206335 RepID=A0A9P5UFC3_9AGAR|nr:hypothetical protein BDP27DRAFT_1357282 [Rhodocollybia butyracea]